MQRSNSVGSINYTPIFFGLVVCSTLISAAAIFLLMMILFPPDEYVRTDQKFIVLTGIDNSKVSIWVDGHSFQEFSLGKYCNPRGPRGRHWTGPVDIMRTHRGRVYAKVNIAGLRREICS